MTPPGKRQQLVLQLLKKQFALIKKAAFLAFLLPDFYPNVMKNRLY